MAKATRLSNDSRDAALDAITARLNGGFLRIYDGSKPASPDTAITTQVLLAELALNATAFSAAVNGSATANAITDDSAANATGTASWARLVQSNGTTAEVDITVGEVADDPNLVLNSKAIQQNARVSVTGFTLSLPNTGA